MSRKISEYFKVQPKISKSELNDEGKHKSFIVMEANGKSHEIFEEYPKLRECHVTLKDIKNEIGNQKLKLFEEISFTNLIVNKQSRTFECDFDGKTFKCKGSLKNHMPTHFPKINCLRCNRMLQSRNLNSHIKNVHSTIRKFQCKICSKNFKSAVHCKVHEKIHNKEFPCEVCNKNFTIPSQLAAHKKLYHENARGFKCDVCEKQCFQKAHLINHQKTHDKNRSKPLKCHRCDFSTDNKSNLKNHANFHERQDKKFAAMINPQKCEKCSNCFKNKKSLICHMENSHSKFLYQCDLCAKFSRTKNALNHHIKTHLKKLSKNEVTFRFGMII